MAGFKEGSVDGWGDEAADDSERDDTEETENEPNATPQSMAETAESEAGSTETGDAEDGDSGETARTSPANGSLPWIHSRSSITDGREQTVQLHLQQSTIDTQRERQSDVEQLLGESVRKADLREAALIVGLQHVDDVTAVLREWGYDVE